MLIGSGLGYLIDVLLWELSYDYVYPPQAAQAAGLRFGGWFGTCMAAVSVVGTRPLVPVTSQLQAGLLALIVFGIVATSFAGTAWGAAKLGVAMSGSVSLPRAAFCTGLVRGSVAGAVVAALFWSATVWYRRCRLAATATSVQPHNVTL